MSSIFTVLVTGGDGLCGKTFKHSTPPANIRVIVKNKCALDITDYPSLCAVFSQIKPDAIINCAAFTHVDAAQIDKGSAFKVNAFGAGLVAHIARVHQIPLIHLSTDFVFDGSQTVYGPDFPPAPLSVYGQSKYAGENVIQRIHPQHYIVRTSWLFGEYGENFVTKICTALQKNAQLHVVNDQIGTPTYCPDLVAQLFCLITRLFTSARTPSGIYHFAGFPPISRFEWALQIHHVLKTLQPQQFWGEIIPSVTAQELNIRPASSALMSDKLLAITHLPTSDWKAALPYICQLALSR